MLLTKTVADAVSTTATFVAIVTTGAVTADASVTTTMLLLLLLAFETKHSSFKTSNDCLLSFTVSARHVDFLAATCGKFYSPSKKEGELSLVHLPWRVKHTFP